MGAVLLYDADCGFCTRVVSLAPRLRLALDIAAIQSADLETLGVSASRAATEVVFVAATGQISYGHLAIGHALGAGPWPMRILSRLVTARLLRRPLSAVYKVVARHRHQLPGGTPACRIPEST